MGNSISPYFYNDVSRTPGSARVSRTQEELDLLEQAWEYQVLCGGGFRNAMICGKCKNRNTGISVNTDTCNCAKASFFARETPTKLSEEQITQLERKKKRLAEEKEYAF